MAERAIYEAAIARWGSESQLRMVQEECGELVAAIGHLQRGRCSAEAVAEEIADVLITAGQAALIVGEGLVAAKKAEKLERLRGRLSEAEAMAPAACRRCDGTGRVPFDNRLVQCGACGGIGKAPAPESACCIHCGADLEESGEGDAGHCPACTTGADHEFHPGRGAAR